MPPDPVASLDELLRALSHERNLRGRMRVLGRSWQLLRGLTPAEREKVALRMGSSWAWKRLEKSFLRDGQLDDKERLVGRIFERLGDADPRELRGLAAALRRGDRAAGKDLLLMTLREALEEEAAEAEAAETQGAAAPAAADAPAADTESDQAGRALPADRAAPARVSPAGEAAAPRAEESPAVAAEGSAASAPPPPPSQSRAPALPPERPAAPSVPARRPVPPAETTRAARLTPVAPRPGVATAVLLPAPSAGGLERLRALRALQREDEPGAELGRAGRAALLDALGQGWAPRRALSRMIAAGSLDDLDEALELIARLARAADRTWCLADLIAAWDLDAESRERVLDAAPSDAARRRLARRCA